MSSLRNHIQAGLNIDGFKIALILCTKIVFVFYAPQHTAPSS